jgi:hypothetical protein
MYVVQLLISACASLLLKKFSLIIKKGVGRGKSYLFYYGAKV